MKASYKKTVSPKYSDLLACMTYDPNGELPLKGNVFGPHKDGKVYYYCEAVEVAFADKDDKTVGLGRNPFEQFCYSVAKSWRLDRDYLPDRVRTPLECEEQESVVGETLFECLHKGVEDDNIPSKCFKALDDKYKVHKQDDHKTMPKSEEQGKAQRALTAILFTADLSTVGGTEADLAEDSVYGGLTLGESEQFKRLATLFNAVKEAHKFATLEKWLCAQCYALNMPTEDGVLAVYGEAIKMAEKKCRTRIACAKNQKDIENAEKALKKQIHTAKVKYSKHANEIAGWLLDEVEKSPEGLEKWLAVANRRKASIEATAKLAECEVKYTIPKEIVKHLHGKIDELPNEVIRFCDELENLYA